MTACEWEENLFLEMKEGIKMVQSSTPNMCACVCVSVSVCAATNDRKTKGV